MASAEIDNPLPPACEQAAALKLRLLETGALEAQETSELEKHLAECPACRTLQVELAASDAQLQDVFSQVQVSNGFAARTMAALPPAAGTGGARVFSAPPRPWLLTHARLAAAFVLGVLGVAVAMVVLLQDRALAVSVAKGLVTDQSGQVVARLYVGQPYKVKETTVLTLKENARIKAEAGTQFQLEKPDAQAMASVRLDSGDLYASTHKTAAPLHVSCADFDTDLQGGDFFVAQDSAEVTRGIVIVFEGLAGVTAHEKTTVPVAAGQVFVSVGSGGVSFFDTFDLRALDEMQENPAVGPQSAGQRTEYRLRVEGYQKDVADLKKELAATPQDSPRYSDLNDRHERVVKYLEAHRRRLEAMSQKKTNEQIPFEEIRRGVKGHTDPKTWL